MTSKVMVFCRSLYATNIPKVYQHAGLDMLHMKHQSMLQCMHTLESAGKGFGDKKLQDLSELGELVSFSHETRQVHAYYFMPCQTMPASPASVDVPLCI